MAPLIPVKVLCSHQENIQLYKRSRQYPPSVLHRTDHPLTIPHRYQQLDELLDRSVYAEHCGFYPNGKAS